MRLTRSSGRHGTISHVFSLVPAVPYSLAVTLSGVDRAPSMKISTILDYIDSGHIALPEFQRGYVWNRDQVRGLFGSLYRRHPVGGLLVWATESKTATHRGDGPLAAGVVKLLLDGQQVHDLTLWRDTREGAPSSSDGYLRPSPAKVKSTTTLSG